MLAWHCAHMSVNFIFTRIFHHSIQNHFFCIVDLADVMYKENIHEQNLHCLLDGLIAGSRNWLYAKQKRKAVLVIQKLLKPVSYTHLQCKDILQLGKDYIYIYISLVCLFPSLMEIKSPDYYITIVWHC